MSQSYTNLLYHLIFSTKERQPIIALDYKPRLYDYIGGIIRGLGGIGGASDHVHVWILGLTPLALRWSPASQANHLRRRRLD